MASTARSLVIAAAALALLTACADPSGQEPTASPTESPSPTPTAAPSPTPTPTPTASAVPTASPQPDTPQCADAMVIDPESAYTVSWGGTYEEQIAASDPGPGFEPADLLDSDRALCSVVYDFPVDGPGGGVGRFSTAIVRDADAIAYVEAWAAAHGYAPVEPGTGSEYVLGEGDVYDANLVISVIGEPLYDDEAQLESLERRSGLDLEPTDVLVTHVTLEATSE